MWAGVHDANRYPADYPVTPPHLTGLIFGSVRLVKASPTLPKLAELRTAPAGHAGAMPARQPGTPAGPPQAP